MAKRKAAPSSSRATDGEDSNVLVAPSSRPLVFISHDSRDANLAEAFSKLLTGVSAGVLKSFRSSDKKGSAGIEYGSEWYTSIMAALEDATDVVALLTPHSIGRPWILFEVGVAKGNRGRDSVVFGVALGVPLEKSLTGPFSQFQNCGDDEDELTKLIMQLIRRMPDADPNEEAIRSQVQTFRKSVGEILKQPVKASGEDVDETTVAKLFEEVKVMFRDLPQQVDSKLREMAPGSRRRRRRRFLPMMFEDMLHRRDFFGKEGGSDSLSWLMFVTLMRDDAPWLYELGMEVYRALRSGNARQLDDARSEFQQMARAMRHGHPMLLDLLDADGDEDSFMAMRHLPMIADKFLHRLKSLRPATETTNGDEAPEPRAENTPGAPEPEPPAKGKLGSPATEKRRR